MNSDSKRLLDEVLEETAPADFREALLSQTLRHVRRRRQVRTVRRGLLMTVGLLAGALLWRAVVPTFGPAKLAVHSPESSPYELVRSKPLDPAQIVRTKPALATIVTSSPASVPVVATVPGAHLFRELTDEELLVLMVGRPVALVRRAPEEAELVFLNPADQEGFPVQ